MKLQISPGTYVVAVSGGVDSMTLLHMLVEQAQAARGLNYIVAHFDHGIRIDSSDDRKLVQAAAQKYKLPFVYAQERLGISASEATARAARYDFLRRTQSAANAKAIITAHHQDDMVETALLNLLRGTGRKGMTSLRSHPSLLRPLLASSKQDLIDYARKHSLEWREDSTNQDTKYRRNFVRNKLMPKLSKADYEKLRSYIVSLAVVNDEIDSLVEEWLGKQPAPDQLSRHQFVMLPHAIAKEVMAAWLYKATACSLSKNVLEEATIAAKTFRNGKLFPINKHWQLAVNASTLALDPSDR